SISEVVYPSTLDAYLRGRTWKEIGFAQRYLCAYGPAAEAFERAEWSYLAEALIYDAATASFARATIHYLAHEYHESATLIAKARQVFQGVSDQRRLSMCEVLDGCALARRGDLHNAQMKLEDALGTLLQSEDLHTIGAVYNNLGFVYRALGKTNEIGRAHV